jgi:hypothetical protein
MTYSSWAVVTSASVHTCISSSGQAVHNRQRYPLSQSAAGHMHARPDRWQRVLQRSMAVSADMNRAAARPTAATEAHIKLLRDWWLRMSRRS